MKLPEAPVVTYTTATCPYCVRAKQLLRDKQIAFVDVDVTGRADLRAQLAEHTGRTSVPQIFIHGQAIGGCDDLFALNRSGQLEQLLHAAPAH